MADQNSPTWRTSLSNAKEDEIRIRGYDITDLVGNLDFASAIFLLHKNELPTEDESAIFNAIFVSTLDHGISPSHAVTRYVSAAGHTTAAATAAGILTWGDYHGGGGEEAANMFLDAFSARTDETIDELAASVVSERLADGKSIHGYLHPEHRSGDPRAPLILDLAKERDVAGEHVELALAIEEELIRQKDNPELKLNVEGAIAAVLLDMGFSPQFARVRGVIARTPALIAHSFEEAEREPWWRAPAGDFEYDGPTDRTFDGDHRE